MLTVQMRHAVVRMVNWINNEFGVQVLKEFDADRFVEMAVQGGPTTMVPLGEIFGIKVTAVAHNPRAYEEIKSNQQEMREYLRSVIRNVLEQSQYQESFRSN